MRGMFAETAVFRGDCRGFSWTAGQRIDPSRESTFVWRLISTAGCRDTVLNMTYTNWGTGEPNWHNAESCMTLESNPYRWNDVPCHWELCSVCEI